MAQNNRVEQPVPRYTRADFAALRAWLNRLPLARIAALYYTEDDLEALGCEMPAQFERRLEAMRDHLIARASLRNPLLAEGLAQARRSARWSAVALKYLFEAAEFASNRPQPEDAATAWLKPRVCRHLAHEGVRALADLKALIELRGPGWWRPIPRLGAGKAAALERWLAAHTATLGALEIEQRAVRHAAPIVLRPETPVLVPLERIALADELDGRRGLNRASNFSLIAAGNDLEALHAFLVKYRGQEKTRRAYRKELERFLLWCLYKRHKPLSSVLAEDCEAYKAFLAAPDPAWCGKKAERLTVYWKPFSGALSAPSQRYAITVLKTFFAWLVDVRYLAGNPWVAVGHPIVETRPTALQLERALPEALWARLSREGGVLDEACERDEADARRQARLVRAALLLIGQTGVRREEAARARRGHLKPLASSAGLWELEVLGKRKKWRTVFLPPRAIEALRAHWADREEPFDDPGHEGALISPLIIPATPAARERHLDGTGPGAGFSVDGLYRCLTRGLRRIADHPQFALEDGERALLRRAGLHAFRHTFGTIAAANALPLDVLQRVMGHASLGTTSLYVQAERARSIEEMGKFFGG
jgi:integrase